MDNLDMDVQHQNESQRLRAVLPGVPVIESPFFYEILSSDYFSEYEKPIAQQLYELGFAVIDFPDEHFHSRSERLKTNLGRYFSDPITSQNNGIKIAPPRIQDAFEVDEDVYSFASNSIVLQLLKKLYGRQAFPFQTLNFQYGSQQHFHTDSVHFSSNPERFMCGVWVAMDDVTETNGPLYYYPGSHRWPIYTNEHIGFCASEHNNYEITQGIYHQLWADLVRTTKTEKQYFYAKSGTALIWAANLLHGGEHIIDHNQTRWSQVTHYYFEGCSYYTPMLSDVFYGKTFFREPINIIDNTPQINRYLCHPVPEKYVTEATWGYAQHELLSGSQLPEDFDPEMYLAFNPDVAMAGADAFEHYMLHGRYEQRKYR